MANQNQKLLGALVEHAPVKGLSTADKQYWIQNGNELALVLAKVLKRALLTRVGTVSLATTGIFTAVEKFVVNTSASAEMRIAYIGDNFTSWFLAEGGKVESVQLEHKLRYAKLKKAALDFSIIADLGGEARAETVLTDLWGLLKKQAHGGKGPLLTNGYANVFYIRDHQGTLRAIRMFWGVDGWYVDARSVEFLDDWDADRRVFSRNP